MAHITPLRSLLYCAGAAAATYAVDAGVHWARYGRVEPPRGPEADPLLDRFMPAPEVLTRHHIRVTAPADRVFAVAGSLDLSHSPIVQGLFKGRELLLRAAQAPPRPPRGLREDLRAIGWVELAEVPGREVVFGAATKPWEPSPAFVPIPPDGFAAFAEPAYVKIVWTLCADPLDEHTSILRTETRAMATDAFARARFRLYWSCLSPGIRLIRHAMLVAVRREAERIACRPVVKRSVGLGLQA
jgi:hypothetical protein